MKGETVEKHHHLTAGVLFLLGAIFLALWKGVGFLEEFREKKQFNTPESTQQVNIIHKENSGGY